MSPLSPRPGLISPRHNLVCLLPVMVNDDKRLRALNVRFAGNVTFSVQFAEAREQGKEVKETISGIPE